MARATHITISTADRIRLDAGGGGYDNGYDGDGGNGNGENEVRQEVQVSITYALDPGDVNLVALAGRKALEVKLAHEAVWNRIGAFSGRASGISLGRCPSRHEADEDKNEDKEDDGPEDGSDEDPMAGLPPYGDDPFGGGPAPAGAARPFPAVPTSRTQPNGQGDPPPKGWYLPGGSGSGNGGPPSVSVPASSVSTSEPDAEPVTGPQRILIRSRAKKIGLSARDLDTLLYQQFRVWRVERLTKVQAASLLDALERDLKEREREEREGEERPTREKNGTQAFPGVAGGSRAT